MNEKTRTQIEEMKKQTIGVEVEMNNIERSRAAKSSCSISAPHRLSSSSIRSSTLARLSSRSTAQPIRPPTTEAGR